MNKILNTILILVLILVLLAGTLFLLSFATYAWTYSGWNTITKLEATMPLVMWLLMIWYMWKSWK